MSLPCPRKKGRTDWTQTPLCWISSWREVAWHSNMRKSNISLYGKTFKMFFFFFLYFTSWHKIGIFLQYHKANTWVFLVGDGLALCGNRVLEDVHSVLYSLSLQTNLQWVDACRHVLCQQVAWLGLQPFGEVCNLLWTQTWRTRKIRKRTRTFNTKVQQKEGWRKIKAVYKLVYITNCGVHTVAPQSRNTLYARGRISICLNSHNTYVHFRHTNILPLKAYVPG